ncbi:MAG: hypothetical protein GY710_26220 [Desulfobacteraceae bacterium]|nr:hypothetical protein [Desulfobacteraceae bacterium]
MEGKKVSNIGSATIGNLFLDTLVKKYKDFNKNIPTPTPSPPSSKPPDNVITINLNGDLLAIENPLIPIGCNFFDILDKEHHTPFKNSLIEADPEYPAIISLQYTVNERLFCGEIHIKKSENNYVCTIWRQYIYLHPITRK